MSRTQNALVAFEQREGRPWRQAIEHYARQGYTWTDVADMVGVKANTLKQWCFYRQLTFPWQGAKSPIEKERQRRSWADRGMAGDKHAPRYTVQGITGTLTHLAGIFGINRNTVWTRINRYNMSLEEALTTPVATRQQVGDLGQAALKRNGTHSKFWQQDGKLDYVTTPDHSGF